MTATGLFARIAYAIVALPFAAMGGFSLGIAVFTRLSRWIPDNYPSVEGYGVFLMALGVGTAFGFTAFMFALTLPWKRLRKRRGRPARMAISAVVVFCSALVLATEGQPLAYVAALCVWLALTFTYTFIRYGVLDSPRRSSSRDHAS